GPMTADDLLALPDDGWRYEVVEGVLVRVAGSGDRATAIGLLIGSILLNYVRPRRLGRVTGAAGVYKFPTAATGLLPDVGFYGVARFHLVSDRDKPIPFAPELAVEVASRTQGPDEMAAKVRRYLRSGTRVVWAVWPSSETVDVWHPADVRQRPQDMRASA